MNILITGGAGFLGSRITNYLILRSIFDNQDYQIRVVDNFMYGSCLDLAEFLGVCQADVRNLDEVFQHYKWADVIIHLAAIVGQPACERQQILAWATNAVAVKKLTDCLSKQQRLIYFNTNSGYGVGFDRECFEVDPLTPISIYGRSKCQGEQYALEHNNTVVLRLATVFGWSQRLRLDLLVNQLTAELYFNKKIVLFEPDARRNFVGIEDVCRGVEHFINSDAIGVYNFGNPKLNMTKLAVANKIQNIVGGEVSIGDGFDEDKRNYVVNNNKVLSEGFEFQQSLEQGVEELVGFLKDSPPEILKTATNVAKLSHA